MAVRRRLAMGFVTKHGTSHHFSDHTPPLLLGGPLFVAQAPILTGSPMVRMGLVSAHGQVQHSTGSLGQLGQLLGTHSLGQDNLPKEGIRQGTGYDVMGSWGYTIAAALAVWFLLFTGKPFSPPAERIPERDRARHTRQERLRYTDTARPFCGERLYGSHGAESRSDTE